MLVFGLITLLIGCGHGKKNRQISAMENDVYDIILNLCRGTFHVPVNQRTAIQKATLVRFWRNKDRYTVKKVDGAEKLLFDGKAVVKKSELKQLVIKEFKHSKGIGSRKLKHKLKQRFHGVSEARVNKILAKSKANQRANARFNNKAIIRPIRASAVQVRKSAESLLYFA